MVKNPLASAGDPGDMGSILGAGRSPGVGNASPLQYPCLGNPLDRGAWWATVRVSKELDKTATTTTYNNMLIGGDRCSMVRTTSEM